MALSPKPSSSPSKSAAEPASPLPTDEKAAYIASKAAALQASTLALRQTIAATRQRLEETKGELVYPAADTVRTHIRLLHEYNGIRDVGQGLLGMIAEQRGARAGEVYAEFGVGEKD